jgi:hypothetical protein
LPPTINICDGHNQRRRGRRRHLSEAEFRHCRLFFRSSYPVEPIRLHVEAGGSMARRIEDLIAQPVGNFDRLEDFHRSSSEDRLHGLVHTASMLLLQHNTVAIAT